MEEQQRFDRHENLISHPSPLHHPQSTKTVQKSESKWSDDDCIIEQCDDDSDISWLVATSSTASTTSSENSIGSEDDEHDLESCSSDPIHNSERRRRRKSHHKSDFLNKNERIETQIPVDYHQHQHQHQQTPQRQHETYAIHRYKNTSQVDAIRQASHQNVHLFSVTKTRIHGYLCFYSEFIAKAHNQENLLKLLQWSMGFIGAVLASSSLNHSLLLPQWILTLSYDICYARYVTRLLGLPVALEGAMSGSWATSSSVQKNPSLDTTYRIIGHLLACSMVLYYPAEQAAFFLWMNPSAETIFHIPASTWFYTSMRCWLVYIVVEMIQCVIKYSELQKHEFAMQQSKKTDDYHESTDNSIRIKAPSPPQPLQQQQLFLRKSTSPDKLVTTHDNTVYGHAAVDDNKDRDDEEIAVVTFMELNQEIYSVMLLFIRNLCYIVPCIHWSMSTWDTDPLLSDVALNAFMLLEAVLCLYQAIYLDGGH